MMRELTSQTAQIELDLVGQRDPLFVLEQDSRAPWTCIWRRLGAADSGGLGGEGTVRKEAAGLLW